MVSIVEGNLEGIFGGYLCLSWLYILLDDRANKI